MRQPELSIIIPAYNEQDRLPSTLERVVAYFADQGRDDYEIVVVDDGSTDQTPDLARQFAANHPHVSVVTYGKNRGKGFAVKYGLLMARGKTLIFTDSDLSTPIEEAPKLLRKLNEEGYDLAIASRSCPGAVLAVPQPFYRRFIGAAFRLLVGLCVGLRYRDTQCGFKAMTRRSADIIAPRMTIPGFGFDPELLWLAKRFKLRTAEVGVVWNNDTRSKVRIFRDSCRMFLDLIKIRLWSLTGAYNRPRKHPADGDHSPRS